MSMESIMFHLKDQGRLVGMSPVYLCGQTRGLRGKIMAAPPFT